MAKNLFPADTYIVKKGDTLYNIGTSFGTTVDNIKEAMKFINKADFELTIRKNKLIKSSTNEEIGIINFNKIKNSLNLDNNDAGYSLAYAIAVMMIIMLIF